jgi:SH3-like domain-containing protein
MAADRDAVIVARATSLRSIPTEADTSQKTTPLAAGSMARNDHEFLGWRRLRFDNGQTGWVRREDLVALWK